MVNDLQQMMDTQRVTTTAPKRATVALGVSIVALLASGVSLSALAQVTGERDQIESRLACLELPGPNDCGLDGR